jgi:hypothetical protein
MSDHSEIGTPPSAGWLEVLDKVEQLLNAAHTELQRHEQGLAGWEGNPLPMAKRLEELEGLFDGLQTVIDRAQTESGRAEAAVQTVEDAFRAWLAAGESVSRKLADGASRPV